MRCINTDANPSFINAITSLFPVRLIYQRVPWYSQRLSRYARYTVLDISARKVRLRFEILTQKIRTVETHRLNIRKKLDLRKVSTNLRQFLRAGC